MDLTLVALAVEAAERHGTKPALTASGRTLAFADVSRLAARGAAALRSEGAGRGTRLALACAPGPDWVVAALAVLRSGASLVPLEPGSDDLRDRQDRAGARPLPPTCELVARWSASPDAEPPPGPDPGDEAAVFFTSGSSGRADGIRLPHRALAWQARCLDRLDPRTLRRSVMLVPPHHVLGFNLLVTLAHVAGTHVLFPASRAPGDLRAAFAAHRPTVLGLVPLVARSARRAVDGRLAALPAPARLALRAGTRVVASCPRPAAALLARALSPQRAAFGGSLQLVVSSGAPLDDASHAFLLGLGVRVVEAYGLTETAGAVTLTTGRHARAGEAGVPLPGVRIEIDGADASGEGEIVASGPGVPLGTLDGGAPQDRVRTGDLGRLRADGSLVVTGRRKDVIVLASGRKLTPEDVERRLPALPHAIETLVAPWRGPGGEEACAVIVPDRDALARDGVLDAAGLLARELGRAAAALPPHERPTRVRIAPGPLPRTSSLKPRRDVVARLLADPAWGLEPGRRRERRPSAGAQPASLAELVRAICGVDPAPDSSLSLDLGLDSLDRVELVARAEQLLGRPLPDGALAACTFGDFTAACAAAGEPGTLLGRPLGAPDARRFERARARARRARPAAALAHVVVSRLGLKVTGAQDLPARGPLVLCANHATAADALLVRAALPAERRERCAVLARADLHGARVSSWVLESLGALPIDGRGAFVGGLRMGALALASGDSVIVHPEGGRRAGALGPFGAGAALLALHARAPLVPVAVRGSGLRARVAFGAPVATSPGAPGVAELTASVRDRVGELLASLDGAAP